MRKTRSQRRGIGAGDQILPLYGHVHDNHQHMSGVSESEKRSETSEKKFEMEEGSAITP